MVCQNDRLRITVELHNKGVLIAASMVQPQLPAVIVPF